MSDTLNSMANLVAANYENFIVECPCCGVQNTFNRASDLQTFEPIFGREVLCQNDLCGKNIWINNDSVNESYEMLVFECYELINHKKYMNTILTLCQSYEMFFSLFFRVEFLHKPFSTNQDIDYLDKISELLQNKIKLFAFKELRSLFLRHLISGRSPGSLEEAETMILSFPTRPDEPKKSTIDDIKNKELARLLHRLKLVKIHETRNKVIHKQAYRPNREEAEAALESAKDILFGLGRLFDLKDDCNWYAQGRSQG